MNSETMPVRSTAAMTTRFRIAPLLALLTCVGLGLAGCGARGDDARLGCDAVASPCLKGTAVVRMRTSRGDVQLTLDGGAAPLTAGNFVDLVRRKAYDGTVFHRVVREPTPFVVQGGDPTSADPATPPSALGTGSYIDPASGEARLIPLELKLRNEKRPRYGAVHDSPTASRELALSHQRGAVAMARSGDPNSASAQFYVALEALPELDGHYAVFGRVTGGMDVVDRIQQGDRLVEARVVEGGTLVKGQPD
jgi:peptidyl-prolyl cis-trans isomerase B (cyclophilin B)